MGAGGSNGARHKGQHERGAKMVSTSVIFSRDGAESGWVSSNSREAGVWERGEGREERRGGFEMRSRHILSSDPAVGSPPSKRASLPLPLATPLLAKLDNQTDISTLNHTRHAVQRTPRAASSTRLDRKVALRREQKAQSRCSSHWTSTARRWQTWMRATSSFTSNSQVDSWTRRGVDARRRV